MLVASGAFAQEAADLEAFEASGRLHHPMEKHLAEVQQLTFGGENAEAYWSPDGKELIFQSTREPYACDQIFRIEVPSAGETEAPRMVSTGLGRTTCAYFTADGEGILYSSTHEGSKDCPPVPDRSQGYVWPLYDTFQVYRAKLDGSDPVALTDTEFYAAEATVCPVDGSIVFTSTRDGDLELYRMDADGGNVRRLTDTPGYDGGAFFSRDCSKIVWRASRPSEGKEMEDYKRLLSQDLVRPGKLEVWVANSDGSEAQQITYLGAASFAPYFFPDGKRVIFSTNHGTGSPREFDLWAVNVDGTALERITYAPGFDGFPIFSPDGKTLAFASNRNQGKPGETDVYVARWEEAAGEKKTYDSPADRFQADVAWLAADERQGRGVGTKGLEEAGRWIAEGFSQLGLEPAGADDTFFQPFEVPVEVEVVDSGTELLIGKTKMSRDDYRPAAFSASTEGVSAGIVAAGYGITAPDLSVDDYEGVDAEGKIVVVRRFTPEEGAFEDEDARRRFSDLRYKAFNAREHGAIALVVVDLPATREGSDLPDLPEEAPFPPLRVDARGDAGIPVIHLSREQGSSLLKSKSRKRGSRNKGPKMTLRLQLETRYEEAFNVAARIPAGAEERHPGALLVGAHYDHLGLGGSGSLAPEEKGQPHNGADDNASGVAALLEIARVLNGKRKSLQRDVVLVAFSGEESGLLGSTAWTRTPPGLPTEDLVAMLNLDMVGRLRDNRVTVLGGDSGEEWKELVPDACSAARLLCSLSGDGYGPSDQTPFYASGVPVLHFFTGAHEDYHKPSDDTAVINASGGARIAALVADVAHQVASRQDPLTYRSVPAPAPRGDSRSYGAYLGTIPDYAGPEEGGKGVLLAGVRDGSPAQSAGMQRGDRLVALGGSEIGDIHDFVFILRRSRPDERVSATVIREGQRVDLQVTFGSRSRVR